MHLENFDLNLMVAIEALLRQRSVTRAAKELHITQSAMSSALKRARLHFEDEILYYDGQMMMPTPFGRSLEQQIPDMVSRLRAVSRMRPQSDLAGLTRRFSIIASDYIAAVYVSALVKELASVAPNISVSVLPFTREAVNQFRRGAIEFLIGPEFALHTSFDARPLFTDRFKSVLWDQNPILTEGFTEERFFASRLVVTNFFLDDGKSHFERWLGDQDKEVKIAAALPSFVVLPHFVSGTMNVATIHNRLVPQLSGLPDLVFCDPPVDVPVLQEYLVCSDKLQYDQEAQLFADLMLSVGEKLGPS